MPKWGLTRLQIESRPWGIPDHWLTPAKNVTDAVHAAFISALGTGLEIGAAVMVVGAAIAWTLIERSPAKSKPEPAARPEAPAHEQAAEATLVS